ncbi:MAG TPA: hypothetical protein VM600_01140 [Actinomycetota bacterium]|nr:hypothetical protein [Actinomycetota bacterium]
MDIDFLERCRCGDRNAFRGLVGLWSDRVFTVARALSSEAASVTADAFVACWNAMPSMHSRTPFRPWLMAHVARAAQHHGVAKNPEAGATLLQGASHPGKAERAIAELLESARDRRAPSTMYDDLVAPRLGDIAAKEARAPLEDGAATWARALEPDTWCATTVDARTPLHERSRMRARGRIGSAGHTKDSSVVVLLKPAALLAWTTETKPRAAPSSLEFRWSLELTNDEVIHRLRAVAFPQGLAGRIARRAYTTGAETIPAVMAEGVARLAAARG